MWWLIGLFLGGVLLYTLIMQWGEAIFGKAHASYIWLLILSGFLGFVAWGYWLAVREEDPERTWIWIFFLRRVVRKAYIGFLSLLSLFIKERPATPYIDIRAVKQGGEAAVNDTEFIEQGRRLKKEEEDLQEQKQHIKEAKEILAKPPGKLMKELKATPEGNPLIESLKARKGQWKARIYIGKLKTLQEVAKAETALYQALTKHHQGMKEWAKEVARAGGPDGRLKLWLDSDGTPNLRKVIEEELEIESLARQREKAEIKRDIAKFTKEAKEFEADITNGEGIQKERQAAEAAMFRESIEKERRFREIAEEEKAKVDKDMEEGRVSREEAEKQKKRIDDRLAQYLKQARLGLKEDEEVEEV